MPTTIEVTKKFTFEAGLEGLVTVGASTLVLSLDAVNGATNEGNGGGGVFGQSLDITTATAPPLNDKFRQSTSQTWEDWGVPVGATVVAVSIPSYWVNEWAQINTYRRRFRVVDSGGVTVLTADLDDQTPVSSTTWRRGGNTTKRSVIAGKVASNTVVKFEFELDITGANASDWGLDSAELLIEATTPDIVSVPINYPVSMRV